MEIVVMSNETEVARVAADIVAEVVRGKQDAVLGLATGSSPLGLYAELAARVRRDSLVEFGRVRGFALDEYVGIAAEDPRSYRSVISAAVVEPLHMDPALVAVPDGTAPDLAAACDDYERRIRDAGGVDVQILGIGSNGHIGFNEPTSSFASRTRVKTLAPGTRADNARFFDSIDEVPKHCVTQGLGTIMESRHVLLIAQGASKSRAIAAAVEGPVTALVPASILQHHPHVTVIVDEAAAADLGLRDYYETTLAEKPAWQAY